MASVRASQIVDSKKESSEPLVKVIGHAEPDEATTPGPPSRRISRRRMMARAGALLAVALLSLLARPAAALNVRSKATVERSIDLAASGLDNGLERGAELQQHPHGSPDKPSKFDLDVSQYTETDDESLYELEKTKMQAGEKSQVSAEEKITTEPEVKTTVATTTEEENSGKPSNKSKCDDSTISVKCIEKRIGSFLRTVSTVETLNVTDSVQIVKKKDDSAGELKNVDNVNSTSLVDQIHRFAREHVVKIKLPRSMLAPRESRTFFGAFGLKKLLLPLFIGAQIIKSILIALFLPSIIGSIGKIVGKGVTSFAQSSQNPPQQMEENYEFKDNQDLYNDDYMTRQPLGTLPASAMYDESMLQTKAPEIASRYSFVDPRLTPMNALSDRYYTRHMVNPQAKRQDFKVFHEIPTSSLLLTNYDPFYSPLLSRLDAVFSRLGHNTEGCREYAVCAMYRSPARYAPYSNLVSAQLSRELNELRKPSSDNPDVLRFFRYMKAAKDGQDGVRCEDAYADCAGARDDQTIRQNQAMLATYQDIDKLVHARKL
ncbi:uncharacterized protein LOC103317765 isoform X1 [Nasonia vitripennis]|uniref:Uncharacterized protein n=2 Tax=Nasonia vitripennis TaxID=7425 RepID=A0A7M7QGE6_NASVI|nr:uncharacterized protein LOC103317765 isoform X1 [Nasonia vitripennis]